LYINDWMV